MLSNDKRISVLKSYCEGTQQSLNERTIASKNSSKLQKFHVIARTQSEEDFFRETVNNYLDDSNSIIIEKGAINNESNVQRIIKNKPDLLICYGSSIIKSPLLEHFKGRFLNVHLGLSPYYRGSGTNIWPFINKEPEMVGATFMHIDSGIDTGRIIHQIRADIMLGDGPHSIGNRLIRKMTLVYINIICNFDNLSNEKQPTNNGNLYLKKDFIASSCQKLYDNFSNGMIEKFIFRKKSQNEFPYIINNKVFGKV
jgi:phosphoribosylglycinamide formyltransferase 1